VAVPLSRIGETRRTTNDQLRTLFDRLQDSGLLRRGRRRRHPVRPDRRPEGRSHDRHERAVRREAVTSPRIVHRRVRARRASVTGGERIKQPALDYIRSIQAGVAAPARVAMSSKESTARLELGLRESERSAARLPLERLTLALDSYVATQRARRSRQPDQIGDVAARGRGPKPGDRRARTTHA
jgi:hypothetical protein